MRRLDYIEIGETYEEISSRAAEIILAELRKKPDLLLCAAGGSTPTRAYELLVDAYHTNPRAFDSLRIVKLDEWGGIEMDDPRSCETQLQRQLIKPLGITPDRFYSLESNSKAPELDCKKRRECIASMGPIDLCILGLGMNGHIGMNEPAPALKPWTHVARLAEVSLQHPMLDISDRLLLNIPPYQRADRLQQDTTIMAHPSRPLPTYGVTLGMTEILASREVLLMVNGEKKRDAVRRLMQHEITTDFPASFLWLHSNWTFLCSRDAAAGIDGEL
jgi:galactosamine-6-phosphate isomerase